MKMTALAFLLFVGSAALVLADLPTWLKMALAINAFAWFVTCMAWVDEDRE